MDSLICCKLFATIQKYEHTEDAPRRGEYEGDIREDIDVETFSPCRSRGIVQSGDWIKCSCVQDNGI